MDKLHFSQSTNTLSEISEELDHQIKMKISLYMEESQREALDAMASDDFLPSNIFRAQLEQKLNQKYTHAVSSTGKKVTHTLLSFVRKNTVDADCQTISYEEFENQFNDKLTQLENKLASKSNERDIVEKDINRMKHMLEALSLERSQVTQDLDHLE